MIDNVQRSKRHDASDEVSVGVALLHVASVAASILGVLAATKLLRLLEAIAEIEELHDLTMIE